jgi:hypothetical protein
MGVGCGFGCSTDLSKLINLCLHDRHLYSSHLVALQSLLFLRSVLEPSAKSPHLKPLKRSPLPSSLCRP